LKLREIANNFQEVERLKLENKIMRLELQKIRIDDNKSQDPGIENSDFTTNATNQNILAPNNSIIKPIDLKIQSDMNIGFPDRCPL